MPSFEKDSAKQNTSHTYNRIKYIDGLVQDCSNSIVNAPELLQSCIKPSTRGAGRAHSPAISTNQPHFSGNDSNDNNRDSSNRFSENTT